MSSITINSHVFSTLVGKVPHALLRDTLEINEKHDLEGKRAITVVYLSMTGKIKCRWICWLSRWSWGQNSKKNINCFNTLKCWNFGIAKNIKCHIQLEDKWKPGQNVLHRQQLKRRSLICKVLLESIRKWGIPKQKKWAKRPKQVIQREEIQVDHICKDMLFYMASLWLPVKLNNRI